ncbi:voltage-gated potassium channel [Aspergillus heteromorphus CBS 117.55]|uniref:Voltage-gated potassium channel n=1 Tax=Aspergillus heteromorphus CBS 117.55 TaxID=1448321 RepID=A0A317WNK7_9EURO|nr:voltage-gated potassium channel [Aspergillus heteromorphus CBS 117.55]PWY86637.1 voltage-gated potassium channel [Aspergillus heteromorphus CBS 117.55]
MINSSRAVVLKAISLAISATAHLMLLLTMRLKWDIVKGFVVTTSLWCASSAILFSVVGVITQQPPPVTPPQTWRYTQNFYYAIFAAALYILIGLLLTSYAGSVRPVHLSLKDRRSVEDTSIILRALTLATFLLGGAAIYTPIEGWSLTDALYWAVYTVLTVGIGNIAPKTHLGRSLLFPYATAGITSLGLFVASIASFSTKMGELHLRFELEQEGIHIHEVPADVLKGKRIKSEFHRRHRWVVFIFSAGAWLLLWLVSARIFRGSEKGQGWTYFDSLYFTFVSLTTIGYGDLYPTSNFGKAFFVFWALLAVPVMTTLVGVMGQLGFRTVTYFVRRLGRCCPGRHAGRRVKAFLGSRRLNRPARHPYPGISPSSDVNLDIESQAHKVLDATHPTKEVQEFQTNEQLEFVGPAQHTLSIGEQIEKLVDILKDDVMQVDLHREWARIVPLLSLEGGEEDPGSSQPKRPRGSHHRPQVVREVLDANQSESERNKELLWMVKLLIEKLCSHLREEVRGGEQE